MAYPSTFADIQSDVVGKLRLDATNDAQRVKDWINRAYARVCVEAEFPRGSTTVTLSAAQTTVAFPSTTPKIARIKSVLCQPGGSGAFNPMLRVQLDRLLSYRASGSTTGVPAHFAVLQSSIEVYPTTAGGDVVQLWFVQQPTALSGASDVPVIDEPYAYDLLTYGAMVEAADYIENPKLEEYRQVFLARLQDFVAHLDYRAGDAIEQRFALLQRGAHLVAEVPSQR